MKVFCHRCILVATAFLLLIASGCSGKSAVEKFEEAKRSQPHTVTFTFKHPNCRAYFIQNDLIAAEFSKAGTYTIPPGKYLFIGHCPTGSESIPLTYYPGGATTDFVFEAGAAVPEVTFGIHPQRRSEIR